MFSAMPVPESLFAIANSVALVGWLLTVLLAGWIHYLAFDLYVGAITTRIARRENIPHVSMLPVLFLTFMFGPVGLLAFWIARSVHAKRMVQATP